MSGVCALAAHKRACGDHCNLAAARVWQPLRAGAATRAGLVHGRVYGCSLFSKACGQTSAQTLSLERATRARSAECSAYLSTDTARAACAGCGRRRAGPAARCGRAQPSPRQCTGSKRRSAAAAARARVSAHETHHLAQLGWRPYGTCATWLTDQRARAMMQDVGARSKMLRPAVTSISST
jgi:hypothetical protein